MVKLPLPRPRAHEIKRRREAAVQLWSEGYTRDSICRSLGVSHGTLSEDLAASGVNSKARPRSQQKSCPPTVNWRDNTPSRATPAPAPRRPPAPIVREPAYKRSLPLDIVRATSEALRRDNGENCLAHDAEDAVRADDEAWFIEARESLRELTDYLHRLQRVLDDPAQRTASLQRIDELTERRPFLRAVEQA